MPPIKTQARSATILPNFVGLKFQIHNGKSYLDITITEDMVGRKLGEFAPYVCPNPIFVGTRNRGNADKDPERGSSSRTSRQRTNKQWNACASNGSLGIILVYLEAILYYCCTNMMSPSLGQMPPCSC
jgi:hypothetical protein